MRMTVTLATCGALLTAAFSGCGSRFDTAGYGPLVPPGEGGPVAATQSQNGTADAGPVATAPAVPVDRTPLTEAAARARDEAAVLELVFRDLLRTGPAGEIRFLSLGEKPDQTFADVPPDLFTRLADTGIPLRSPAAARLPRAGEEEPDGTPTPVKEAATGKKGAIYWVKILKWPSDTEVLVDAARYGGPGDASGYQAKAKKVFGKWVMEPVG